MRARPKRRGWRWAPLPSRATLAGALLVAGVGDVAGAGEKVVVDSLQFAHTPTITWVAEGANGGGTTFLVGQMAMSEMGVEQPSSGKVVLASANFPPPNATSPPSGWVAITAPVTVQQPGNNWCQNYSPWLIPLNGTALLELSTNFVEGTGLTGSCHTLFNVAAVPALQK
jgi:hypothetical protein